MLKDEILKLQTYKLNVGDTDLLVRLDAVLEVVDEYEPPKAEDYSELKAYIVGCSATYDEIKEFVQSREISLDRIKKGFRVK